MNIDDVPETQIEIPPPDKIFQAIFLKQFHLMEKYEPIEKKAGAPIPRPGGCLACNWNGEQISIDIFSLDDPITQMRLKDLFWRATEEVAEAFEDQSINIKMLDGKYDSQAPQEIRHCYEELIDAMHFLVEASIVGGLFPEHVDRSWCATRTGQRIVDHFRRHKVLAWEFIRELGLCANTLKNKPWKQSHMKTDLAAFENHFVQAWDNFFDLLYEANLKIQDIYILYFKKNAVNQFRQRSNY